jgi:hypothetical protein
MEAGRFPEEGVMVSHWVPRGAMAVVKATALVPDLTLTVCGAGNVPPICQRNESDAGVGVSVAGV